MLKAILLVGTGSFFGGASRYAISSLMKPVSGSFPTGTLIANLLGCFAIGLFYGLSARYSTFNKDLLLLLTTGFCGGFTTFSTFSNESLMMLQAHNYAGVILYVCISVIVGIACAFGGYAAARL